MKVKKCYRVQLGNVYLNTIKFIYSISEYLLIINKQKNEKD